MSSPSPQLRPLVLVALVALTGTAHADRLVLRDGTALEGRFVGGSHHAVRIELPTGVVREVAVDDAASLTFSRVGEPGVAAEVELEPDRVAVPSGTVLRVRITQPIDARRSHVGAPFKGVLEDALVVGGRLLAPEGAPAFGRFADVRGSRHLKLSELVFGGRRHRLHAMLIPLSGSLPVHSLLEAELTKPLLLPAPD